MDIKNITQMDIMSWDILSLWMFCPHGCFVPQMLCLRCFVLTDVLSVGHFVPADVLSCRTFCPSGLFVLGCFVLDVFFFFWALYVHP